MRVHIKENSWRAKMAAKYLKGTRAAIVFGDTIHLWNTTKKDFLNSRTWLRHELTHVEQFKKYGYLSFLFMYFFETLRKGYFNNRFEVEARESEYDEIDFSKYSFD
ncbi:MAG TPA: DUF4157 domain-containing protein [Chitinophagaceae bacterium]|nr:DUF4157 domain-containing protein [Chitinophagaceae bacterium]